MLALSKPEHFTFISQHPFLKRQWEDAIKKRKETIEKNIEWTQEKTDALKATPNPKMKWVSDERALAGVHFS